MGTTPEVVLIVGVGIGLSAALARRFARDGARIVLAARNPTKLAELRNETGADVHACDAADPASVARLFEACDRSCGAPQIVVYNPSYRTRGPITDLDPAEVAKTLMVSAFGGFLVGQQAARRMLAAGTGTILFTGASASVKGYAQSAPFAMGKFGLRGLAQSMARELAPKNIHVAHFVIDGGIRSATRTGSNNEPDALLDPAAIAETYAHVARQPRSAWTWEVELRPWTEKF